ncbi:MAG: MmgE/PrpD family protein [Chloroflexi bacterium]|nr:MmgE/PrpD family protein [Chloroflexota bacterium]
MTLEEQLIRHIKATSYSDLPAEAIDAARREVLWTLASCVSGAGAPGSDKIVAFVRQLGGPPEATVIGFGDRVAASTAGIANGAFAKALEYEDKLWLEGGGAYAIATSVVPAAFATAEHIGRVDGKDLLHAIALATDVQGRLVRAVPKSILTGWCSTYVFATFGATIAAGVLLGLTEEELINAMGLAYAQTTGNYQGTEEEGVLGLRLQMGFGVRNGITSAQLAKLGVTGVKHFLTGRHGLYPLFYKGEALDMDATTRGLGSEFLGAQLGFKAYPCCALIHAPLDATLSLVSEVATPDSIESVKVNVPVRIRRVVEPREPKLRPQNDVDSQFSIYWALACALADRRISLGHFSAQALGEQRYLELAPRIRVDLDMADREGASVEIKLKDGRTLRSQTVLKAKGQPEKPLSMGEILDRYWDCLQFSPKPISKERATRAKDLILGLEEVADVAEIVRLIS